MTTPRNWPLPGAGTGYRISPWEPVPAFATVLWAGTSSSPARMQIRAREASDSFRTGTQDNSSSRKQAGG